MKKKIFISGKTREFDSADPKPFCKEIEEYIKANIVNEESADTIKVSATLNGEKEVIIHMAFGAGNEIDQYSISQEIYRCLIGECQDFVAEDSLLWGFCLGPMCKPIITYCVDDVIHCHKKNSRFYKANRYKSLELKETPISLTAKFKF